MADRNTDRAQRRNNPGDRSGRADREGRQGDRSMARSYSQEDQRRYGRQSQEQAERLRRLRGQGGSGGGEHGQRELYRGYGPSIAQREGRYDAQRAGRGQTSDINYDYERDYRNTPSSGRDMNLEGRGSPGRPMQDPYRNRGSYSDRGLRDQGGDWDVQDERDWRDERDWPSGRDFQADIDWQRTGGEYNQQQRGSRQEGDRHPGDRHPGASQNDRYDNFWGARRSREQGPQNSGAWWDNTAGRPGYTSARGGQAGSPYRGAEDWEVERDYDMDPGFSYEFGTDFNFLNEVDLDAERQRHWRERDRFEQPRQQSNPRLQSSRRQQSSRGQQSQQGQRGQERGGQDWNAAGPYRGIGPSGYQRSDERIMEEICDIFTQHGKLDASSIDIQVANGQVELRGAVGRREEKYLAEDVASRVTGVKEVQNHLRVQSGEGARGMSRENAAMPGRIQQRMRVAGVDGKHIGTVKEVRNEGFTLERSEGGDRFIPFRAVKRTNGQIILHVAGNEIDRQGWRQPSA